MNNDYKLRTALEKLVKAKRELYLMESDTANLPLEDYTRAVGRYETIKEFITLMFDIHVRVGYASSKYGPAMDSIIVKDLATDELLFWEYYEK